MRTTAEEMRRARAPDRRASSTAPTGPDRAVRPAAAASRRSTPTGQPFHDPEADAALFDALRDGLDAATVEVHEVDADINDPAFATAMADRLHELHPGGAE